MAIHDNYVMDLENGEEANKSSVRGLTDEEKEQMQKLRKQIRIELGLEEPEIDTTYVRSRPASSAEQPEQPADTKPVTKVEANEDTIAAEVKPVAEEQVNASVSEADRADKDKVAEQMQSVEDFNKEQEIAEPSTLPQESAQVEQNIVEDKKNINQADLQTEDNRTKYAEGQQFGGMTAAQRIEQMFEARRGKAASAEQQVEVEQVKPEVQEQVNDASTKQAAVQQEQSKQGEGSVKPVSAAEIKSALSSEPLDVSSAQKPEQEESISDEEFFEKYQKKTESTIDISSYGKYDSDLDFKLNRKIKKIRLPMPKGIKALVASIVMVVLAASVVGIALWLYKPPEKVELTRASIAQNVSGVYVGDKLSYDNLYIDCEYSDGSTKRIPISSSMVTSVDGNVQNGIFTRKGDVWVTLNYQGKKIIFSFTVSERVLQGVSIISLAEVNDSAPIEVNAGFVDISDKIIVLANYDDGTSWIVDINKCKYSINNSEYKDVAGGKIDLSGEHGNVMVRFMFGSMQSTYVRFNVLI